MSKVFFVILMALYKFTIEQLYIHDLSKIYAYLGVRLNYNGYKMIISWIIFFMLIILILSFEEDGFWLIVMKLFAIFVIIPSVSLYGLKDIPTTYFIYDLVFWFSFIVSSMFLSRAKFRKLNNEIIEKVSLNDKLINSIFIFCALTVFASSYLYGDLRITIKFDDIYKYRLALREVNMPVFLDYMLPFMGTILLPVCAMEYLNRKKYIFVILTLFIGLMLFSINGMKTWIFVYFIVFAVHFITKKKYDKYTVTNCILLGFIFASVAAYITAVYYGNNILSGIIHRMTIGVPEISYYFVDYIFDKQPLLLRGSILRHIFEYPYSIPIEFQIGGIYIGDYQTSANNGLLGDAYANFKFFGVVLYPYLYAFVFKILHGVLDKYDYKTSYILILILIWATMNISFFTWLLTGGVFVVCILYYLNFIHLKNSKVFEMYR